PRRACRRRPAAARRANPALSGWPPRQAFPATPVPLDYCHKWWWFPFWSRERTRLDQLGRGHGVDWSFAVGGAQPCDRARAAGRLAGVADPPPVPDQPVREHRPVLARDELAHLGLDLFRFEAPGPAEPPGQPPEVRVHRDARDAEGV